jgi:hypothetical protein
MNNNNNDSSLTIGTRNLSYNARNALLKGVIIGAITAVVYLAVVVFTTPNLPPSAAINAALKVNGIIIIGLAIGVGIQIFTSTYGKGLECRLDDKKRRYEKKRQQHDKGDKGIRRFIHTRGLTGGSGGSTAISSFLSFFSLVPLGCCGSWLFILSVLPSVFGGTVSVILIEYSIVFSYVGLAIVIALAALSVLRLRKELRERRLLEGWYPNSNNDSINKTLESKRGGGRGLHL